jgi:OPA family glycerol-3-phosphate transporter-like MFS transporter
VTKPAFKLVGDNLHYERWRWQVFTITWLTYFGFYLTRKTFSVAKIGMELDPSIEISRHDMAWIDGAFLSAYAIGQFVSGIMGDRVGTRKVVVVGMFGSALAAAAMGASSITLVFGVLFGLQGLCQSTGWAPLVKNVGNFFSQHERGTVIGLWSTNYAVGGMVASVFAGYWGDLLGWRYAFFVPAATLLVIWLLFVLFQRNRPEDVGLPPIEVYHNEEQAVLVDSEAVEEDGPESSWELVKQVLADRTVLVICLAYFLTKPARYAILFWGPKYIQEKLGTGMAESGALSALFELAGIAGALSAGIISDRVFNSRRMPVCVITLTILGVFMLFMDELPATRVVLGASYILIGLLVFVPDTILNGPAAVDFGTKKGAGTVAGFVNGAGSIGAILGGTIPGLFAERWGWDGVFTLLGAMAITAAVILLPKWNALPATAAA